MASPERQEYMRQYYQLHKEDMKNRANDYQANFPEQHAANMRRYALRKRYGLSIEAYDNLYASQHGRCAICRKTLEEANHTKENGKPTFYVDHSHITKRIRGLLCARCNFARCNFGIGWYDWLLENSKTIEAYLEEC